MDLRFKPYNLLLEPLHTALWCAGCRCSGTARGWPVCTWRWTCTRTWRTRSVSCICPECGEGEGEVQISLVSAMAPIAYTHHTTGMLRLLAPLLAQVPRDMA